MIVIRKEQFIALSAEHQRGFEARMLHHLREQYLEETQAMDDPALTEFVRQGIETAAGYGIEGAGAVAAFLELQMEFGRELELAPYRNWALKILRHPPLRGSFKVSLVRERLDSATKGRRITRVVAPPA